jgi:hypothetical protein
MSEWDPKSLWDELRKAFQDWTHDDEGPSSDPSMLFHLMLTVPLLIALIAMARLA